jgi:hypothetical protein
VRAFAITAERDRTEASRWHLPKPGTWFRVRPVRHSYVLGGPTHEYRRATSPTAVGFQNTPVVRAIDRLILRCTKELFGVPGPVALADPPPEPDEDDCYDNPLWFERRKCLLLTTLAAGSPSSRWDLRVADWAPTSTFVGELVKRKLQNDVGRSPSPTRGAGLFPFAKTADPRPVADQSPF